MMTMWQKQFAIHRNSLQRMTIFLYRLGVLEANFTERFGHDIWKNFYRWDDARIREHAKRDRSDPNIFLKPKKNIKPTKTRI